MCWDGRPATLLLVKGHQSREYGKHSLHWRCQSSVHLWLPVPWAIENGLTTGHSHYSNLLTSCLHVLLLFPATPRPQNITLLLNSTFCEHQARNLPKICFKLGSLNNYGMCCRPARLVEKIIINKT